MCVPLGITGILLDCSGLFFRLFWFVFSFAAGGPWTLGWRGPTKTHPSCRENAPAWCTWAHYKTQLVATLLPFCKVLVSSADLHATTSLCRFVVALRFGPPFRLKTPRLRWFPTGTLRNWNPRPACGAAFSSVCISISVFGLVPTRDEPAECLPWTCVRTLPLLFLSYPMIFLTTVQQQGDHPRT